jgi:hypothetical protein
MSLPVHFTMRPSVRARRIVISMVLGASACGPPADDLGVDSTASPLDTAFDTTTLSEPVTQDVPRRPQPPRRLTPLEDSISQRLVFVPSVQNWLLAAGRSKRLLLDIGRVDFEVRRDSTRATAFRKLVAAYSPLPAGTKLRLRGFWGGDDAEVTGFDTWNGRIVAVLSSAPRVDSIARTVDPLTAVAVRADSALPAVTDTCALTVSDSLRLRLTSVRDSLELTLSAELPPDRLAKTRKSRATEVVGCFAGGRAIVAVSHWAGEYEWARERVVMVDSVGLVRPLAVRNLRFKLHELLGQLDADEDGFHDIAARGFAERQGATVVLRLLEEKRLERLAAGFAWENR